VFQSVVWGAEVGEVVQRGVAAVFPGLGVVEVASGGWAGAAGEPAGSVAEPQYPAHRRGDGVVLVADGEHHPGLRVRQ
jgi:hypothetical protein